LECTSNKFNFFLCTLSVACARIGVLVVTAIMVI